jgi:hypothetical protein
VCLSQKASDYVLETPFASWVTRASEFGGVTNPSKSRCHGAPLVADVAGNSGTRPSKTEGVEDPRLLIFARGCGSCKVELRLSTTVWLGRRANGARLFAPHMQGLWSGVAAAPVAAGSDLGQSRPVLDRPLGDGAMGRSWCCGATGAVQCMANSIWVRCGPNQGIAGRMVALL